MANTPKKNIARAETRIEANSERAAKSRAVFVMPRAAAAEADSNLAGAEPAAEVQQNVRAVLEKSVVETRAAWVKAKTAVDEASSAFEVSFAAAKDGALAVNAKALEALRVNADANFDFLRSAFAAKSLSDLIGLQAAFARTQVEAMAGQTREIGAVAQKAMTQAVEPIKEQVAKSFKIAV